MSNKVGSLKQVTVYADEETLEWLYDQSALAGYTDESFLAVLDERDVLFDFESMQVVPSDNPLIHRKEITEID